MAAPERLGKTLKDPVAIDWKPDLKAQLHEINEYLEQQGGYDIIDYLFKDLLTKQPTDPIQHMLDCLVKPDHPTGPLKVIVTSPPGVGRRDHSKKLATHFGLQYISAGEVLSEAGVDTSKLGLADDKQVSELVVSRVKQAESSMKGWILDGFPRTKCQASYLTQNRLVPSHILALKATEETIQQRQQLINDGQLQGEYVSPEVLSSKLGLHARHSSTALEAYSRRLTVLDVSLDVDATWVKLEKAVRTRPRSLAPSPPPRVVIVGPRGTDANEFASRLAFHLGAVFVDGQALSTPLGKNETSTLPIHVERLAEKESLGAVGARLRQNDCIRQGWVLSGFPADQEKANFLAQDVHLVPSRVIALTASVEMCCSRLEQIQRDPVTQQVFTTPPTDERIRQRLVPMPGNEPDAVTASHAEFSKGMKGILKVLGGADGRRCLEVSAEDGVDAVYNSLVEFVERPLPLLSK
eukprot:TRINITY_DN18493_c1_g1_i1.p1 TRINITY_DN18493_c1_g1~~TRINITY_DN18493_c1_g1_i1.p1  ORF type:complete len:503 (+),score=78.56 TRINITY_DN18493_c1_g1_i1:112-1509(+)